MVKLIVWLFREEEEEKKQEPDLPLLSGPVAEFL